MNLAKISDNFVGIFSQTGLMKIDPSASLAGHMPVAQHIHLNLFFLNLTTLIVNLRALDQRIDYRLISYICDIYV